jgi:hypothetical protein
LFWLPVLLLLAVPRAALFSGTASRAADDGHEFKKEAFDYRAFAKGKFSEVVTVTNPRRTLYVAGVGSEDENATTNVKVLYPVCKYTWGQNQTHLREARRRIGRCCQSYHLRD